MKDLTKRKPIRSKAIRQAANGEACTVCGVNNGTTVFCHLNESWAGKGTGQKADDIAGMFLCAHHHDIYDRRKPALRADDHMFHGDVLRAMYRTIRRLLELGIIEIKP